MVGYSGPQGGAEQAFLWQSGTGMQALGTLPGGAWSSATGINNNGQVVGLAYTGSDANPHAFLWQTGAGMLDLNSLIAPSSGWTLNSATAINDKGQIVGYGNDPANQSHAFLLTPCHARRRQPRRQGGHQRPDHRADQLRPEPA